MLTLWLNGAELYKDVVAKVHFHRNSLEDCG